MEPAAVVRDGARAREGGFSLIEVLVASVIFLFIALAIIPMFTMSARSNSQGQDNTKVANLGREHFEELMQLPFSDPSIAIQAGVSRVINEYYDKPTDSWKPNPGTPPPGVLYWRVTTIRDFDTVQLDSAQAQGIDPVPLGVAAGNANIKEITVEIHSTRTGGPLGAGKEMTIRGYKSI